jgi:hypothetical protein
VAFLWVTFLTAAFVGAAVSIVAVADAGAASAAAAAKEARPITPATATAISFFISVTPDVEMNYGRFV